MNRSRQIAVGVILVVGGLSCLPSAWGQSSYRPATPTISPWMSLFQRNPGPLDNYHSYVQPQLQLQQTLTQQNAALQQQNVRLQMLGNRELMREREEVQPTGTGSVFMDYNRFFQTQSRQGGAAVRQPQRGAGSISRSTASMSGGRPSMPR